MSRTSLAALLALPLALSLCAGCAQYNGIGLEVIDPATGRTALSGSAQGVRVSGDGIGWYREMFVARFVRVYLTLRVANDRPGALRLEKDAVRIVLQPDLSDERTPYEMVSSSMGNKIKSIVIAPGEEGGAKFEFIVQSYSRSRDGSVELRFEDEDSKEEIEMALPIHLQNAPLEDPKKYDAYMGHS